MKTPLLNIDEFPFQLEALFHPNLCKSDGRYKFSEITVNMFLMFRHTVINITTLTYFPM